MGEVTTIGLDLAKSIFQVHGADAAGGAVCRKKLRRDQMLAFFAGQRRCLVAMEACWHMRTRRRTVEHPFSTIKQGARHSRYHASFPG